MSPWAASSSIRGRFTFSEVARWNLRRVAFTWRDTGSSGWRFKVLAMSDKSTSQEASRSVQRAIKLLVKSSPIIRCSLADSARRVRVRVQSNSCTLPISCIVCRWRAWTRASISRVASKTRSLWGVVFIGSATPLPPASG